MKCLVTTGFVMVTTERPPLICILNPNQVDLPNQPRSLNYHSMIFCI